MRTVLVEEIVQTWPDASVMDCPDPARIVGPDVPAPPDAVIFSDVNSSANIRAGVGVAVGVGVGVGVGVAVGVGDGGAATALDHADPFHVDQEPECTSCP